MPIDLEEIYREGRKRKAESRNNRNSSWYKQPRIGASCPVDKTDQLSVAELYWNAFGCSMSDMGDQRFNRALAAKKCASERMADMHHILQSGKSIDSGHAYPIKLAYGLGKKCLKMNRGVQLINTAAFNKYDEDFQYWYEQIKQAAPDLNIDILFQKGNPSMYNHPLTGFDITHNVGTRRARKHSQRQTQLASIENNSVNMTRESVPHGPGAGAAATAPIPINMHTNMNINENNNISTRDDNNQRSVNSNNFLSSSFAHQKPKGKKKQGGRRQTHRRRALHKKATRRR